MNELLSNEEIDTLLELFRSEEADLEKATPGGAAPGAARSAFDLGESIGAPLVAADPSVRPVDLLKPNRISREQLQGLEMAFNSAAKALGATISDKLRLDVVCDCVAVEQARFQSWLNIVGSPLAIYVLRMSPLEAPVLLTATTSMLYGAVDRILGGSGRVDSVPSELTAAEYTVADAVIGPCMDRLCESLEALTTLTWSVEDRLANPSMAQIVPGQDVILAVHFQVSGDFLLGDLRLAIPFAAIEPFVTDLRAGAGMPGHDMPGAQRATLERTVRPVPLQFGVELGEADLSLAELLKLRVGDVVALRTRVGTPLVAPVQGVPKFTGQVGRIGRRLAFEVGSTVPVPGAAPAGGAQ